MFSYFQGKATGMWIVTRNGNKLGQFDTEYAAVTFMESVKTWRMQNYGAM